jgi:hypothetical protein
LRWHFCVVVKEVENEEHEKSRFYAFSLNISCGELYNTQLVGNLNLQDSFLLSPIANILRLTTLLPSSHHLVSSVLASSLLMYMFLMGELDLMD